MAVYFQETQKFKNIIFWSVLSLTLLFLVVIITLEFYKINQSQNTIKELIVASVCVFIILILAIYLYSKAVLITRVTETGIQVSWQVFNYTPFTIHFSDIQSVTSIKYKFVGYGYRVTKSYGEVFNAYGKSAVSIVTKNGNQILIGSQKADELANILNKLL